MLTLHNAIGVMRYLQNEWQRNERDRIQWDLERAEMKVSLFIVVIATFFTFSFVFLTSIHRLELLGSKVKNEDFNCL